MRPRAIRLALACVLTLAMACGSSPPTSPTPPSGGGSETKWNGTWQFVSGGATVTDVVSAALSDDGANVTGTWTSQSGATGTLRFVLAATITGTITIAQPWFTGGVCGGTSTLTGTLSASSLEFTIAQIPPSGVCVWGSDQKFSLRK
jgi:hypothetical protein